jgi:Pin2-interacting protein X1
MNDLKTKKTITRMGSQIIESRGSKVSSFALRQMEKMGWSEGMGLGKNNGGMTTHLKTVRVDDNAGIGAKQTEALIQDAWWHDAFASNLSKFKKLHKKKKRSKISEISAEEMPSFDELFQATGGARLGMRARMKQTGKLKRTERIESNDADVTGVLESFDDSIKSKGASEMILKSKKRKVKNVSDDEVGDS